MGELLFFIYLDERITIQERAMKNVIVSAVGVSNVDSDETHTICFTTITQNDSSNNHSYFKGTLGRLLLGNPYATYSFS